MQRIKDVLRLKLEHHHSHQHIASSLGISKGVVAKYVKLASAAGLYWPQKTALRAIVEEMVAEALLQDLASHSV